MSTKDKRNIYIFLSKVILIALLVVFIIRCFFVEPFMVSSSQMESSLSKGDRVLVNKTSYGIRLPITLLTIPFTFDKFLGYKSYSSSLQMSCRRMLSKNVQKNDVVLFNNPNEVEKPLDKRSLILSRCIGLPGDTVHVFNNRFTINGKEYIPSPDMLDSYSFSSRYIDTIITLLADLDIPQRELKKKSDTICSLLMTKYESYLLTQNFICSDSLPFFQMDTVKYHFIIPYKGMNIKLNPENTVLYEQAIAFETGEIAKKGKSMNPKKGKTVYKDYIFADDYYWMLSDNVTNSVDSRSIGFIPHKAVIGKAGLVWLSKDRDSFRWIN